jgi:hypothetical protein
MAVQKGNVGTEFLMRFRDQNRQILDISTATLTAYLRKANGTVLTVTPSLKTTGVDGLAKYLSVSGDLDVVGFYSIQGYVVIGAGSWYSSVYVFEVAANLNG